MSVEKSQAIVIRTVDFSETSLVVTLYTRNFGKIGALAKGARRPKNPFDFALDLLAICRVVFLHKSSSSLDLLTEAKLEKRFRAASRDLYRFYAGLYLAELLSAFTDYDDPCPELFDAAVAALHQIDDRGNVASWMVWFEWALLHFIGQQPRLSACAVCGRQLPSRDVPLIGMAAGGALCPSCRAGQRHQVRLTSEGAAWLQMISSTVGSPEAAQDFIARHPVPGEVAAFLQTYLRYTLGRTLRSEEFLLKAWRDTMAPQSASSP